jgi:hypothetical protein
MMHKPVLPPDGDGAGDGGTGGGAAVDGGGGAAVGADDGAGAGAGDSGASGCPPNGPGDAERPADGADGLDATGCAWPRCPGRTRGCVPGWCGATGPLLAGGAAAGAGAPCRPGVGIRRIPAAEAPTTIAVAAGTHAAGRARSTFADRPSHERAARNNAIPAGGSPACQPVRREARIASTTAAR